MLPLRNIKLTLAYDGTLFFGWQQTKMGSSIEECLKLAVKKLLNEAYIVQGCSRTDRGVHALHQVANFFTRKQTTLPTLQKSLNALLPPSIRVVDVEEMDLSFHPTLDATGKEYCYSLWTHNIQSPFERHTSWHIVDRLDIEKMKQAALHFVGTHDFGSFCNMRKNLNYEDKIREVFSIDFEVISDLNLRLKIKANHFLYKMARNIVGTLVYVGKGKIEPEQIPQILRAKQRSLAGITAPAHGLTLTKVFYPERIEIK
jgi:tRNA pseudouridine38-40 synthase